MNPRLFFLAGILASSLAFALAPRALRHADGVLRFVLPLLAAFGTACFGLSYHQTFFDASALAVGGLFVAGACYFWLVARFVLLLVRAQGRTARWPPSQGALWSSFPSFCCSRRASILAGRWSRPWRRRWPLRSHSKGPSPPRGRFGPAARVLRGRRCLACARCSACRRGLVLPPPRWRIVAPWPSCWPLRPWCLRSSGRSAIWACGATRTRTSQPISPGSPASRCPRAAWRCSPGPLSCAWPTARWLSVSSQRSCSSLAGLFVVAIQANPTAEPLRFLTGVIQIDELLAHLLFWAVVACALDVLDVSPYRVMGAACFVYALTSVAWVPLLSRAAIVDTLLVMLATYALVVAALCATWFAGRRDGEAVCRAGRPRRCRRRWPTHARRSRGATGCRRARREVFTRLAQGPHARVHPGGVRRCRDGTVKTHVTHID